MNIITLTTDFGVAGWFVGTMKGVILGSAPRATIVDINYGIPSGCAIELAGSEAHARKDQWRDCLHRPVRQRDLRTSTSSVWLRTIPRFGKCSHDERV
ncbi:MAG: SAM-dependent chlorinase/fluorinase [Verrucomicrobiota bacterium]